MNEKNTIPSATVLIVDDMEMNRNVLHDFVLTMGYRPVVAESGARALEMVEQSPPDLILLDIMMPDPDGVEVLTRLKSHERYVAIPVIMITALDEMSSAAKCIELGADDYLTKPFNPTLLKARLLSSLGKKWAHDREQQLYADLQESYANLKKAEQVRDSLANMIVHDLNNPLTIVSATCALTQQAIAAGIMDDEMLNENLRNINEASNEMIRLVRGILDVSKLESGEMPVHPERVCASVLAKGIWQRCTLQAEVAAIILKYEPPPEEFFVWADEELLRRIIQNLVSNALKHTSEGICVTLSLRREGDEGIFTVSDNGPGIRAIDIERIFEKFFQAASRTDGRKYGVGMGLTFCRMASVAQKGRIWVESEEGHGAAFHVALPIFKDA
ncbi:MAG: hybrid sensor histidine kinase/response regulator [Kiritimatiellae bacterium]|nr:hybrid sensor histidine kinase/response regulator [Kiritimatiellia bacterium]MDD4736909.1 hybrid sensor histidine kinase/response regulator [Kiritimatiellia bacterium]